MERSGKGLIISLVFKDKVRHNIYKKASYSIRNVSKKDLSKIIREFEKLPYESYDKKRPKHEPTDSYFYLARKIAKFMMRSDALNSHVYPVRTKMTAPYSHVCSTDEDKSKDIIVHETLLRNCSTDEDESKVIIINKNLSQNCSANEDKLGSTEEDKS